MTDDRAVPIDVPTGQVLVADRLCLGCGFNLAGRPIVTEPRHGLRIVRCPHCPRVVALETHPPLERWLARWTTLLAGLWVLLLTGFATGNALLVGGLTLGFTIESTETLGRLVRNDFRQWQNGQLPGTVADGAQSPAFERYWAERGEPVFVHAPPPLRTLVEWEEAALLLIPAGFAFATGATWSLLLLAWPVRRLLVAAAVVALLVAALLVMLRLLFSIAPPSDADTVSWRYMFLPALTITAPLILTIFALGLAVGRPLARGLVRAFVPPSFRGALAFLWTSTGRAAPAPPPAVTR